MTELGKDLQRRLPVQAFSGSSVQALGDRVQFVLGVARQICAFGEVLAQQPSGMLSGPALPRTLRVSKAHSDGEPLSQTVVRSHLVAAIIGQGFPQRGRDVPELLGKPVARTLCIRSLQPGHDDQARGPFHEGAHGRTSAGSLDQIAVPVTGDGAGLEPPPAVRR